MARRRRKTGAEKPKKVDLSKIKSTADVPVPKQLIDQVVGQEKAVQVMKKAARQKRNVLLLGEPGTGKSLLAQAMAEMLPPQELEDVLVTANSVDENMPRIKVVKAGEGRKIVDAERVRAAIPASNTNLLAIAFVFLSSFFLLTYGRQSLGDVITAAMLIGLFAMGAMFMFAAQVGKRGFFASYLESVKLLVDNSEKKKPPFIEATGSRAGALLGDVRHDPLQSFTTAQCLKYEGGGLVPVLLQDLVDELIQKYPERIERNAESYEGVVLPANEEVYLLGYQSGNIVPVRVLCANRGFYSGPVYTVRDAGKRIVVTPEHGIYVGGKYFEAKEITGEELLTTYSPQIISRDDIIRTFSEQDQKDAYKYFDFLKLKNDNPSLGYKKIAKILRIKPGQTRWWNNGRFKPKALRTVERLEGADLLPFSSSDVRAPIAARILGTTFGDGGVFGNLNAIFLSSSEPSSLDDFENDLKSIFGEMAGLHLRRITSGVRNTGRCVSSASRDIVRFFVALGAPIGRKNKKLNIPAWIYSSEKTEKEFFGAFLGNELCSPRFSEESNKVQDFGLALAGTYELKENRLEFLTAVSDYLKSYGIKTSSNIYENNFRGKSFIWKLSISKEIENLLRFAHFMPVRYSKNKENRIKEAISKTLARKTITLANLNAGMRSDREIMQTLHLSRYGLQKVRLKEKFEFDDRSTYFSGLVYNVTTESGNFFANGILAKNSGGLGTPAHLRTEAGAVHKAHKGVLFIDEIATLRPHSQQELLTAMQEKKYSISGQSEMSSGALVHTEPVPCDFVLVASGNARDIQRMHPALRSRIRGYGYEVYMEESIPDSPENRGKLVQFVAQEVLKDGKIPHFAVDAVEEIIAEARKRSGRKNRLTLKLRELGGLLRAAGDVARERNHLLVTREDILDAKKIAVTIEQQVAQQIIDLRRDYRVFLTSGFEVGKVNGLAVMGDSGIILPLVAEVAPAASKQEGRIIATGKLGNIAKEAVENVSAIFKKHIGKDTSNFDVHVQFLQTYEGVEGDSASISVATAVISALEEVPVDQSIALTGSLSVRGEVLPVGGVTQKVDAAIEAGVKKVLVPKSNFDDLSLGSDSRKKIEVIPVSNLYDVLKHALKPGSAKQRLLSKIRKEFA